MAVRIRYKGAVKARPEVEVLAVRPVHGPWLERSLPS
jgi:hypothetical protein